MQFVVSQRRININELNIFEVDTLYDISILRTSILNTNCYVIYH